VAKPLGVSFIKAVWGIPYAFMHVFIVYWVMFIAMFNLLILGDTKWGTR
jgi:hypothetical protein